MTGVIELSKKLKYILWDAPECELVSFYHGEIKSVISQMTDISTVVYAETRQGKKTTKEFERLAVLYNKFVSLYITMN